MLYIEKQELHFSVQLRALSHKQSGEMIIAKPI
jgi:hypothetical protein